MVQYGHQDGGQRHGLGTLSQAQGKQLAPGRLHQDRLHLLATSKPELQITVQCFNFNAFQKLITFNSLNKGL